MKNNIKFYMVPASPWSFLSFDRIEEISNSYNLEVDLVDIQYGRISREFKESSSGTLGFVKTNSPTPCIDLPLSIHNLRFAIFHKLLKHLYPEARITLRVYRKLVDLSDDLHQGHTNSPCHMIIGGDIFDGYTDCGDIVMAQLIVYGSLVLTPGGSILTLSRSIPKDTGDQSFVIRSYLKIVPRELSFKFYRYVEDMISREESTAPRSFRVVEKLYAFRDVLLDHYTVQQEPFFSSSVPFSSGPTKLKSMVSGPTLSKPILSPILTTSACSFLLLGLGYWFYF